MASEKLVEVALVKQREEVEGQLTVEQEEREAEKQELLVKTPYSSERFLEEQQFLCAA